MSVFGSLIIYFGLSTLSYDKENLLPYILQVALIVGTPQIKQIYI